jgi:threonine dehydrogenase-like Zn-dependent dehydrogenase
VAKGSKVTQLQVGDRVGVECVLYCGKCYYCQRSETHLCIHYDEIGFTVPRGGYSEYVEIEQDKAHKFSSSLDFERAALTEPAAVAGVYSHMLWHFLTIYCV